MRCCELKTGQIADFIVRTTYEQLPEQAIRNAKKAILDCVGVTLAGSREDAGRIITTYVKDLGGKPVASVIGGGFRTSAVHAALANGTMAHALEYDDYVLETAFHPSVAVLPAVLALGEECKVSGREILLAYVVGHEVGSKICRVIGSKHYERGWHATPIVGTMGAAAASAKILKLDQHQTKMALGIAASQVGGMRENFGSFTKAFHAGHAAKSGVMAGQLAQKGFTSSDRIIEGDFGFVKILGEADRRDSVRSFDHLGSPYDIVSPGVTTKYYPCCACSHRAVDGLLQLVKEHGIHPEDISEVLCKVSSLIPEKVMVYHRPKTAPEGKFSLEFCIAIACLDRELSLRQFTDEKVVSPKAQALMEKVKIVPVQGAGSIPEAIDLPEELTIKLKNGKTYECRVAVPKGDYRNPMSDEEVALKYRNCASFALPVKKIDNSLRRLKHLETLPKIAALMKTIR